MARSITPVLALAGVLAVGSGTAVGHASDAASLAPVDFPDGLIVLSRSDCGLDGLDPLTGRSVSLAPGLPDCPTDQEQGAAVFVTYDAVAAADDLRTVVYSRRVLCGGHDCSVSPTDRLVEAAGVYLTDPWSGTTERLDDCPRPDCRHDSVSVSADGRLIAFEEHYRGPWSVENPRQGTLVLWDRSSGERRRVGPGHIARDLRWSPDGRTLAFFSASSPLGPSYLEVVSADGTDRRVLVDAPGAVSFRWSADGRSLVVVSDGAAEGGTTLVRRVGVGDASDTVLATLGPAPGIRSPDGRSYAYIDLEGSLWLLPVDSGISRRLFTASGTTAWPLFWSPDSSRLMYGTSHDELSEFFIVGIEPTATPRPLTSDTTPLDWIPGTP